MTPPSLNFLHSDEDYRGDRIAGGCVEVTRQHGDCLSATAGSPGPPTPTGARVLLKRPAAWVPRCVLPRYLSCPHRAAGPPFARNLGIPSLKSSRPAEKKAKTRHNRPYATPRKTLTTARRTAIREYLVHYHTERNHQGLSNRLIVPITTAQKTDGPVQRKARLGGTLSYYCRDAA